MTGRAEPATAPGFGLAAPITVICLLNVVDDLDDLAFALLAPEIRGALDVSTGVYLALTTLPTALIGLLVWPVSMAADRFTRIRMTQSAAAIWATMSLVVAVASSLTVLAAARVASAFAKVMNEPVHGGLLADYYPPRAHGRVFSLHQAANSVAGFLAPVIGGLALAFGWRAAFALLALPSVVVLLLALRLREPPRRSPLVALGLAVADVDEGPVPLRPAFRRLVTVPTVRSDWLAGLFAGAAILPFPPLLSFLFEERFGLGPGFIGRGGVFAAFGIGALGGVLLAGRLGGRAIAAHRFGRIPSLAAGGLVLSAGAGLLLASTDDVALAVGLTLLIGFIGPPLGVYQHLLVTLVAPPRLRAQAGAGYYAMWAMGGITSSFLVGSVVDAEGMRVALTALSGLLVVAAALFVAAAATLPADVGRAAEATS